jgi:hypothetical protein
MISWSTFFLGLAGAPRSIAKYPEVATADASQLLVQHLIVLAYSSHENLCSPTVPPTCLCFTNLFLQILLTRCTVVIIADRPTILKLKQA